MLKQYLLDLKVKFNVNYVFFQIKYKVNAIITGKNLLTIFKKNIELQTPIWMSKISPPIGRVNK